MDTLRQTCLETGGRIVVVEDHYPQGGIGSAVLEALASANTPKLHLALLAVRDLPGSGEPKDLLEAAGISARHIAAAARDLVMD
ncbi:transketolase C-terminal domain-containing protein [Arthrobacter sp. MMS24-S77]